VRQPLLASGFVATSGTQKTEYNFTGQRLDDSTDLLYYGARYYDPALRRFISADTIVPSPGNPQASNRYSYVLNNPLRFTDPTGHWTFEETPDDPDFRPPTWPYPATRSVSEPPEPPPPELVPALKILSQTHTGGPLVWFALTHSFGIEGPRYGILAPAAWQNTMHLPQEWLDNPVLMGQVYNALTVAHELFHVMQHAQGRWNFPYPLNNEIEAFIVQEVISWEYAQQSGDGPQARLAARNLADLTRSLASGCSKVIYWNHLRLGSVRLPRTPYWTPVFQRQAVGIAPVVTAGHILGQTNFSGYVYGIAGFHRQYLPFVR